MTNTRKLVAGIACVAALAALPALRNGFRYDEQFRESIAAAPSKRFWLGTDALGRDRWTRLTCGAAVSFLLAPAAAALSVAAAMMLGAASAVSGRLLTAATTGIADVFLSVPWFFLLTAVRALLPLNTASLVSVLITFLLLGLLGWAGPARLISIRTREILASDHVRQARAAGLAPSRILLRHLTANLVPIAAAQFWTLIPLYILAEANLSVLGLGVAEPLPSLGLLLRDLEAFHGWSDLNLAAPLFLLVAVVFAVQHFAGTWRHAR
jgi:peptide/nickel transport system permease protein